MRTDRSIFLDNKYTRWYFKLVLDRQVNPRSYEDTREHHIVPKCKSIGGHLTDPNNLVTLTLSEHLFAHRLLTKVFEKGTKPHYDMVTAFVLMAGEQYQSGQPLYKVNRREYADLMADFREARRQEMQEIWSDPEQIEKRLPISLSNLGKANTPEARVKRGKAIGKRLQNYPEAKRKNAEQLRKARESRGPRSETKPIPNISEIVSLLCDGITVETLAKQVHLSVGALRKKLITFMGEDSYRGVTRMWISRRSTEYQTIRREKIKKDKELNPPTKKNRSVGQHKNTIEGSPNPYKRHEIPFSPVVEDFIGGMMIKHLSNKYDVAEDAARLRLQLHFGLNQYEEIVWKNRSKHMPNYRHGRNCKVNPKTKTNTVEKV
jgi:hypothetical protein